MNGPGVKKIFYFIVVAIMAREKFYAKLSEILSGKNANAKYLSDEGYGKLVAGVLAEKGKKGVDQRKYQNYDVHEVSLSDGSREWCLIKPLSEPPLHYVKNEALFDVIKAKHDTNLHPGRNMIDGRQRDSSKYDLCYDWRAVVLHFP